jgi:hypothetical protein
MNNDAQIAFVGGREVRSFPKGWQHPRDDRGRFVPLLPGDYTFEDAETRDACPVGLMPDARPLAAHDTEIAAYEAVSEGTPISPAFPNTPEGRLALVNYCAGHETTFGDFTADAETWAAILFGDASVGIDGAIRAS